MVRNFVLGLTVMGIACGAMAAYTGPSALNNVETVKDVLENGQDEQMVQLKGYLINQVSSDKYTFADATGNIQVEIDPSLFAERDVSDQDRIAIYGELERDLFTTQIDVMQFQVLSKEEH